MTPTGRKLDGTLRAFIALAVLSMVYGLSSFVYLMWVVAVVL